MSVSTVDLSTVRVDRRGGPDAAAQSKPAGKGFASVLGDSRRIAADPTAAQASADAPLDAGAAVAGLAAPGAGSHGLRINHTDVDDTLPGAREHAPDVPADAAIALAVPDTVSRAVRQLAPAGTAALPGQPGSIGARPLMSAEMLEHRGDRLHQSDPAHIEAEANARRLPPALASSELPGHRLGQALTTRPAGDAQKTDIGLRMPEMLLADSQPLQAGADFARIRDSVRRLFPAAADALDRRPVHVTHAGSPAPVTALSHGSAIAGAASAMPAATPVIEPMASQAWSQAIAGQSLRLHHQGGGRAELQLHPRDLGTLQISLQLGDQAQLHIASPHAHVRAAIEATLPQLRQAFADNGIALGDTSVGDQSAHQNDDSRARQRPARRVAEPVRDSDLVPLAPDVSVRHPVAPRSLMSIDIFA